MDAGQSLKSNPKLHLTIIDTHNRKGICFDTNAIIGDRVLIRYEDASGLEIEFGTIKTIL
jgi:hypothetical protein